MIARLMVLFLLAVALILLVAALPHLYSSPYLEGRVGACILTFVLFYVVGGPPREKAFKWVSRGKL